MRQDTDIRHIWFTADLHFLHPKIVDICNRPISVEEHDEWLLSHINEMVDKKDTLYILGDVSMASKAKTEKILHRMNGEKYLILGNHDKNIRHSTIFKDIWTRRNFNFNSPSYPNIHIVLDHFPLASWERKVYGSFHLHGHTHGRFDNTKNGLSFDIGVDNNNYLPLNLGEVMDKFTKIGMDKF